MRGYLAMTRGTFQVGVVYRFGFIFTILSNILYISVVYYLWTSIYGEQEILRGLTFDETFLYVALGSSIFILLKTYTDWFISSEIREGSIIQSLIKPIDYQFLNLFQSLGFVFINLVGITLPTLFMLFLVFKVQLVWGIGLLLFPFSLLLAYAITFALDYFIGILAFYTESVWGLSMTKEIIVAVLSGALIPLQFFPESVMKILNWLPFRAIYHIPLMMVTRPASPLYEHALALGVQLLWAVILLAVTRLFYNQAVKVLRVGGG